MHIYKLFQKVYLNKKRKNSLCEMNWTSTLQQLVEIQEAYRVQKVHELDKENVSEDGTWDHTGKK